MVRVYYFARFTSFNACDWPAFRHMPHNRNRPTDFRALEHANGEIAALKLFDIEYIVRGCYVIIEFVARETCGVFGSLSNRCRLVCIYSKQTKEACGIE